MEWIIYSLGLFAVAATIVPVLRKEAWWIRIFDFPRVQIAALAALVLAAYFFYGTGEALLSSIFIVSIVSCILWQLYSIRPYTRFASKQVADTDGKSGNRTLTLLISNVLMENRNIDTYLKIVRDRDPDILMAAEPDAWWEEGLRGLEKDYPFCIKHPRENAYGMLVYSRLKLIEPRIEFLVEKDIPSMHTLVELRSGDRVELHFLHPRPPAPQEDDDTEERDSELLLTGKAIRDSDRPVIVAGDLNDVAWSHTTRLFQRISGLLDPRIGRGFYNTFHARYPLLRFPLDHFFHSDHFKLISLERQPFFGSDHFPILIKLSLEPEEQDTQERPSPDGSDRREAERKIEEGFES